MTAAHIPRPGKRRKKAKTLPTVVYPDGHFTALMVRHDWPPGFAAKFAPQAPMKNIPRRGKSNGFDREALNLPGAAEHTSRWKNQYTSG